MKKTISLVLALVLSLTALSALAATTSPNAIAAFAVSGDEATSKTEGIKIGKISEASKTFANDLVKTGDLVENLYKKTTFVDASGVAAANPVENKSMTNFTLIPMPEIEVGDSVTEATVAFETPIPRAIAEYIAKNLQDMKAFFSYKVDDAIYTYEVEFELIVTGENTYVIRYLIPVSVLQAAQGYPSVMDFEIVK